MKRLLLLFFVTLTLTLAGPPTFAATSDPFRLHSPIAYMTQGAEQAPWQLPSSSVALTRGADHSAIANFIDTRMVIPNGDSTEWGHGIGTDTGFMLAATDKPVKKAKAKKKNDLGKVKTKAGTAPPAKPAKKT